MSKTFAKAIKRLGLTTDPREAGYILPSGEMLDFSGKKLGSRISGRRLLDHSEIDKKAFRKLGAIRIGVSSGFSELSLSLAQDKKPTKQQWKTITRIVKKGRRLRRDFSIAIDVYGKPASYGNRPLLASQLLEKAKVPLAKWTIKGLRHKK